MLLYYPLKFSPKKLSIFLEAKNNCKIFKNLTIYKFVKNKMAHFFNNFYNFLKDQKQNKFNL